MSKSRNIISLLFQQCDYMISKYSKEMQVNSDLVIYFTLEYPNYLSKEKRSKIIFKRTYSKGKNVFHKLTALQSTNRWMTSSMAYICKQVIPPVPTKCEAMKYITTLFPKSWEGVCDLHCFQTQLSNILNFWQFKEGWWRRATSCWNNFLLKVDETTNSLHLSKV